MKCQSCGKREATVRYSESINGKKHEYYLCENCANKMGVGDFSSIFSPMFVSIPEFFKDTKLPEALTCPKCGYTLDDYSKTGMFGCEECYNTFEDTLDELFLKFHGKNRHIKLNKKNKVNVDSKKSYIKESKEENIDDLKEKIKELVKAEKYEEAAIIRDKIKELEKNQSKD